MLNVRFSNLEISGHFFNFADVKPIIMKSYTIRRKERLKQRNESIRKLFESLSQRHPQWRTEAIIAEVATQMYLSSRTVEAIVFYEGIYGEK